MPPVSRAQQKLVYARANAGEAWAKRWVREGATKITPKKNKRRGRQYVPPGRR